MNKTRRRLAALAAAAALTGLSGQPLQAQELPPATKQMRVIVPFAPGGTSDILARQLAQRLGERLGRTLVVENRAGAGGSLGTEATVRADADGSVLLLHSGAIAVDPSIKRNLSYDVQRDLTAVTTLVSGPFALLVNNDLPVKSVAELVAYAKANPGKLNYGTPGPGSSIHLTTEYLKAVAGIDLVHVAYKGASPALTGAMGNEVQVIIDPLATAKRYAQAGKLRALAVTTAQRTDLWPELPTVAEGGVAGFDNAVWYGLFVPSKTPRTTVDKINAEVVAVLQSPAMREWLREQGLQPVADKPEQARQRMAGDIQRWAQVIKSAGIKPE